MRSVNPALNNSPFNSLSPTLPLSHDHFHEAWTCIRDVISPVKSHLNKFSPFLHLALTALVPRGIPRLVHNSTARIVGRSPTLIFPWFQHWFQDILNGSYISSRSVNNHVNISLTKFLGSSSPGLLPNLYGQLHDPLKIIRTVVPFIWTSRDWPLQVVPYGHFNGPYNSK